MVEVAVLIAVLGMVCFEAVDVDCSGVVYFMVESDIFMLGGVFAVVVEVELVVRCY